MVQKKFRTHFRHIVERPFCKKAATPYNAPMKAKRKTKASRKIKKIATKRRKTIKKRGPRRVYFDFAATTPVDPRVIEAMKPFWQESFGNAGALYEEGVRAKRAIEEARTRIARILSAKAPDVIFTGSGTEANNLAILGTMAAEAKRYQEIQMNDGKVTGSPYLRMHAITSTIEHPSVLECFRELERRGVSVTYLAPDAQGIISPEQVLQAITEETILISLMYANNEIGTLLPIPEIGRRIKLLRRERGWNLPYFHTDASQAPLYMNVAVERLSVDLMTVDAQKIYGPKGIGALYRRHNVSLAPVLFGGHQEGNLRPSTENVPLIVGFACALELASQGREREKERVAKLRMLFIRLIKEKIPEAVLNGDVKQALPNIVNISVPGQDGEMLVLALDARGIAAATKTACAESSEKASHVILGLGKDRVYAESALRFSLGRGLVRRDIVLAVRILSDILARTKPTV